MLICLIFPIYMFSKLLFEWVGLYVEHLFLSTNENKQNREQFKHRNIENNTIYIVQELYL